MELVDKGVKEGVKEGVKGGVKGKLKEVAHCILFFYGVASSSSAGVPRSLRQREVKGQMI